MAITADLESAKNFWCQTWVQVLVARLLINFVTLVK